MRMPPSHSKLFWKTTFFLQWYQPISQECNWNGQGQKHPDLQCQLYFQKGPGANWCKLLKSYLCDAMYMMEASVSLTSLESVLIIIHILVNKYKDR